MGEGGSSSGGSHGTSDTAYLRPSLRAGQKNSTRTRFLEAALQVFQEGGFQAATIDRIAKAAGASRATFYLHFKSKADIFRVLVEQIDPDVRYYYSTLDHVLAEGTDEELRLWMSEAMRWFETHRTLFRVLEQIRLTERELGAGISIPPYTDYMPRYLARWPPDRHPEAKIRLWLVVGMFARASTLSVLDRQRSEVDEQTLIETMASVWGCALKQQ